MFGLISQHLRQQIVYSQPPWKASFRGKCRVSLPLFRLLRIAILSNRQSYPKAEQPQSHRHNILGVNNTQRAAPPPVSYVSKHDCGATTSATGPVCCCDLNLGLLSQMLPKVIIVADGREVSLSRGKHVARVFHP